MTSPPQAAQRRRQARPPSAPEAERLLAIAKNRLRAIEQAAENAAADLTAELGPLVSELDGREDREAARVLSTGDALVGQANAIADRCRRTREWLASADLEFAPELSSGATRMVRQMARHGWQGAEIEEFLEGVGVDRPDILARRALDEVGG